MRVGTGQCSNSPPPLRYINWEYVCDEANDCLDGSDECQDCNFDILANDRSLIANDVLAWLVWIMGTVALLGNLLLVCLLAISRAIRFHSTNYWVKQRR